MTYGSVYEAVRDRYEREDAWEEFVHVGDRTELNLADEALTRHAEARGDRTGLRLRDFGTGATETYRFGELDRAANRVANYLETHTDPGARVGAMLPARIELYAVVFGTLKAGRVYVPLAPVFGPDALNYRVGDSGATVLFTAEEHAGKHDPGETDVERVVLVDGDGAAGGDGPTVEGYDAVASREDSFEAVPTHPNDPYTVTYTSGTTGQPKGVPSTHGGPVHLHAFTEFVVDLRPEDTYFVAASPAWSYGLTMGSVVAGMVGTAIGCYRGPFDPGMLFGTFEAFDVDNAMVPPTALRAARAAGVDPADYDVDLRVLLSAGEALDADTVEWCRETLGAEPQDAYGLTEAGMAVCNYAFDDWEVKPGSMGKPTPGMTVALLDDEGERVEQGDTGEISIRREADAVGGYWGKPDESMGAFRGPWLRTGDLARVDEDGYWWYVARKDSVIVSAGYRIGPGEVEETLLAHDAVGEVCVVGRPHETRGEVVMAYVSTRPGVEPNEDLREELVSYAREQLSKHEYPREVEFVDELPKTATGKVRRGELEDRARETADAERPGAEDT